jgi:hypothetical protein
MPEQGQAMPENGYGDAGGIVVLAGFRDHIMLHPPWHSKNTTLVC